MTASTSLVWRYSDSDSSLLHLFHYFYGRQKRANFTVVKLIEILPKCVPMNELYVRERDSTPHLTKFDKTMKILNSTSTSYLHVNHVIKNSFGRKSPHVFILGLRKKNPTALSTSLCGKNGTVPRQAITEETSANTGTENATVHEKFTCKSLVKICKLFLVQICRNWKKQCL